jgi:hypothetical protein
MPCAVSSLLFAMLLAAQAQAQSPATTRPDPLDPKAQVPAVRYESSFAQFRRIGDDKPVAWREANDAVARIGGWRVYAREAQQPDPVAEEKPAVPAQAPAQMPSIAPAPAAKSMPAGQPGHKH